MFAPKDASCLVILAIQSPIRSSRPFDPVIRKNRENQTKSMGGYHRRVCQKRVNRESPDSLDAFKDAIRREVQVVLLEMVERIVANFRERLQGYLDEEGRQLKVHIL